MSILPEYPRTPIAQDGPVAYVARFRYQNRVEEDCELESPSDAEAINWAAGRYHADPNILAVAVLADWGGSDLEEVWFEGAWGFRETPSEPLTCHRASCSESATCMMVVQPAPGEAVPLPYCPHHRALIEEQAKFPARMGRPPLSAILEVVELAAEHIEREVA